MAGIYLHIPFCKKACHYCDFHFSTNRDSENLMLEALKKEIKSRGDFNFGDDKISSIYFGGGTPSVLEISNVNSIIEKLEATFHFKRSDLKEITFESNPDDISEDYLKGLKEIGINRLSLGIQSLNDDILKFLNRNHNSLQSRRGIDLAIETGFEHISLDFIYAIPGRQKDEIAIELNEMAKMGIDHFSVYALTIEKGTVLYNWMNKGKFQEMPEYRFEEEYKTVLKSLNELGFEQYEISNYAAKGNYAHHNTNYWRNKAYLGLGPSAHSYDLIKREMNPSNNQKYIKVIQSGSNLNRKIDILEKKDFFNEYIMTNLRTKWGIDLEQIQIKYPERYQKALETVHKLHKDNLITFDNFKAIIPPAKRIIADEISLQLFA